MITFKQLLGSTPISDVPMKHQQNLQELLKRVNAVLQEFNAQSYVVTSGYRSMQDHIRIYSEINAKRKKAGKVPVAVPMGSAHLSGEAVDLLDTDGHLNDWLKNDRKGLTMLATHGLYAEERQGGWQHLQTRKTKYGHWFNP